jgi:hypothetical protein
MNKLLYFSHITMLKSFSVEITQIKHQPSQEKVIFNYSSLLLIVLYALFIWISILNYFPENGGMATSTACVFLCGVIAKTNRSY